MSGTRVDRGIARWYPKWPGAPGSQGRLFLLYRQTKCRGIPQGCPAYSPTLLVLYRPITRQEGGHIEDNRYVITNLIQCQPDTPRVVPFEKHYFVRLHQ